MRKALSDGDMEIGMIGAGQMAEALLRGLIRGACLPPFSIRVTNRSNRRRLQKLADKYGVRVAPRKELVVPRCGCILVAVKPQDFEVAMTQTARHLEAGHVVISMAAGVSLNRLGKYLPGGAFGVRAMPNTSCHVLTGVTGLAYEEEVPPEARELARGIFAAVGEVVEVQEEAMDIVTGLSGSGPAYVYRMVELLAAAGEAEGLSPEVAKVLARRTIVGVGAMLAANTEEPGVLRERIMSPGGTTVAGLEAMERAGFARVIHEGIQQATRRSRELNR